MMEAYYDFEGIYDYYDKIKSEDYTKGYNCAVQYSDYCPSHKCEISEWLQEECNLLKTCTEDYYVYFCPPTGSCPPLEYYQAPAGCYN